MFCKKCGALIESKSGIHKETGKWHTVMYCAKNCDGSKNYVEIIEQVGRETEKGR